MIICFLTACIKKEIILSSSINDENWEKIVPSLNKVMVLILKKNVQLSEDIKSVFDDVNPEAGVKIFAQGFINILKKCINYLYKKIFDDNLKTLAMLICVKKLIFDTKRYRNDQYNLEHDYKNLQQCLAFMSFFCNHCVRKVIDALSKVEEFSGESFNDALLFILILKNICIFLDKCFDDVKQHLNLRKYEDSLGFKLKLDNCISVLEAIKNEWIALDDSESSVLVAPESSSNPDLSLVTVIEKENVGTRLEIVENSIKKFGDELLSYCTVKIKFGKDIF